MNRLNQLLRRVPVWLLYAVAPVYPAWLFYLGLTGGLGVEPVEVLEHRMGEAALQLFVLTLAISPLRRFAGLNLLKFRRAIALIGFFYVVLHLLVWAVLDVQALHRIWADVLKRPYITVGMVAWGLMIPLALTSNDWFVRKLRGNWRKLHRLTYVAVPLGAVHYVMLVKGWQLEPLLYLAAIIGLLALRLRFKARRQPV